VLVTAAAGGTGQFAVQLAKLAGCHVIGTCSSPDKVAFLRSIGCDRPIDYTKEKLADVLKAEYPKGVDVVYESIGGEVFQTCLNALAYKGRLIIIGFISGYESSTGASPLKIQTPALVTRLLAKSQSLRGFMLFTYAPDFPEFSAKLVKLFQEGKLICAVDNGKASTTGSFRGLESIAEAVDYLFSGKNIGKIVVELEEDTPQSKL